MPKSPFRKARYVVVAREIQQGEPVVTELPPAGTIWLDDHPWFPFAADKGFVLWRRPCWVKVKTKQRNQKKGVDGIPNWALAAATGHGGNPDAPDLFASVLGMIEQITQRQVNPQACATSAKPILSLWRACEYPPIKQFAEDVTLVARWARHSQDPLAARDIRAEGWDGGADRSRNVSTICVQSKWGDRLAAAKDWKQPRTENQPHRAVAGRGDAVSFEELSDNA